MASTLVIEDGSGVAGADAYATLASCITYATNYFGASLTGNDATKDAAIRRAVVYMNSLDWQGEPTNGRNQPLAWPRKSVYDEYGNLLPDDEIPQEIIDAQHILARAEFQSLGVLSPDVTVGQKVIRERVGPLETEYSDTAGGVSNMRPVVTMAIDKLRPFLRNRGNGRVLTRG